MELTAAFSSITLGLLASTSPCILPLYCGSSCLTLAPSPPGQSERVHFSASLSSRESRR